MIELGVKLYEKICVARVTYVLTGYDNEEVRTEDKIVPINYKEK